MREKQREEIRRKKEMVCEAARNVCSNLPMVLHVRYNTRQWTNSSEEN